MLTCLIFDPSEVEIDQYMYVGMLKAAYSVTMNIFRKILFSF